MSLLRVVLLAVGLFCAESFARQCNEDRVRELLRNPPADWDMTSLTKEDIDNFICSETLVTAVVDCLESADQCDEVDGMGSFVDDIYSRIDEGNNCPTCDPELMELIIDAVRVVQKRFPKQYIRGLAFF